MLLRAERASRASLSWGVRLDRPASHKLDIALTLFVVICVGLLLTLAVSRWVAVCGGFIPAPALATESGKTNGTGDFSKE